MDTSLPLIVMGNMILLMLKGFGNTKMILLISCY